ncbi:hypothetical protein Pmani_036923 [Petrolisthes manimaculis]|uniref:Uncharacterized protein n=1 Tax=Petrolisthes manimaculis TaxID=1843537 RepID=A0AAE1NJK2_9EUCA|nr:hypothetical protein Pmani_036923 [Petrolisthes manimaculis]
MFQGSLNVTGVIGRRILLEESEEQGPLSLSALLVVTLPAFLVLTLPALLVLTLPALLVLTLPGLLVLALPALLVLALPAFLVIFFLLRLPAFLLTTLPPLFRDAQWPLCSCSLSQPFSSCSLSKPSPLQIFALSTHFSAQPGSQPSLPDIFQPSCLPLRQTQLLIFQGPIISSWTDAELWCRQSTGRQCETQTRKATKSLTKGQAGSEDGRTVRQQGKWKDSQAAGKMEGQADSEDGRTGRQ